MSLETLFYPKNICLLGASTKEKSIGYEILKCIKKGGYSNNVYPVNPKADEILGYKNYKTIAELPEDIDLCIVTIPKNIIWENLNELVKKNVKNIILITAGFREVGKEGKELEDKVLQMLKEKQIRMVGPNCMGIINTLSGSKLNATFVAEEPEKGAIAFASQSGALGAAILNSLRVSNISLGHFISMGNKADINENDLLKYWAKDVNINVITMYLESFVDGKEFIINSLDCRKPILVLKSARSKAGQKAASSHTGALANSDDVVSNIFEQFGIIRVDTVDDLFNSAIMMDNLPVLKGKRIAIVTNSGGPGVICVDKLEKEGLELAQISDETKERIRAIIHPEGSANNPIDLLPNGDHIGFEKVTKLVLQDNNVDGVIVIFTEPIMVKPFEIVEAINSIDSEKPIVQVVFPLPEFWEKYKNESKYKKRLFKNVEDAVVVLKNSYKYYEGNNIKNEKLEDSNFIKKLEMYKKYSLTKTLNGKYLNFEKSYNLLKKYELPVVPTEILSYDKLENLSIDFPVVLKAYGENIIHKSDIGGVVLNIKSINELKEKADYIKQQGEKFKLRIDEFIVQKFVKINQEILIGGYSDHSFGPMLMFGSGGKYVEVFNDVQLRSSLLSLNEIKDMVSSTKIGKILSGIRGEKSMNLNLIYEIIDKISFMLLNENNILELDFNPITYVNENELTILDWRIKAKI